MDVRPKVHCLSITKTERVVDASPPSLQPKVGLLGMIMASILEGKAKDAIVVPISIQYDRLMEGTSLGGQLNFRETQDLVFDMTL